MKIYRIAIIGDQELPSELEEIRAIQEKFKKIWKVLRERKEFIEVYIGREGDFDLIMAATVGDLQVRYGRQNNRLSLVLPCPIEDFSHVRIHYDETIISYDEKTPLEDAIERQNRRMVDMADLLVSYVLQESGTAYESMKYAQSKGMKIVNLSDKWVE